MKEIVIKDYVEICDQTLGVYGATREGDEWAGQFDFATLKIDPEFVLVRRTSLKQLIEEVTATRKGDRIIHLVLVFNTDGCFKVSGAFNDKGAADKQAAKLNKKVKRQEYQEYLVVRELLK